MRLLLLAAPCLGHVKLYYEPARLPIRNALSASSDGRFSVSGPCGGANTWGANGFAELEDGQTVALRANYNGGHASAENAFRVAYRCDEPGAEELLADASFELADCEGRAGGVSYSYSYAYPLPAPDGDAAAYYGVACALPAVDGLAVGESARCTLSMLDHTVHDESDGGENRIVDHLEQRRYLSA